MIDWIVEIEIDSYEIGHRASAGPTHNYHSQLNYATITIIGAQQLFYLINRDING